jgi:hypothetical protein
MPPLQRAMEFLGLADAEPRRSQAPKNVTNIFGDEFVVTYEVVVRAHSEDQAIAQAQSRIKHPSVQPSFITRHLP